MDDVSFNSIFEPLSDDWPIGYSLDGDLRYWMDTREKIFGLIDTLGGVSGNKILINCDNNFNFLIGFLATLALRKIPVLLPNRKEGTTKDFAGAYDFMLTDQVIDSVEGEEKTEQPEFDQIQKVILFTSGSTGEPKKIEKTLAQLEAEIRVLDSLMAPQAKHSVVLSSVSYQHIYGLLFRVLWPLLTKRIVADFEIQYPEQLWKLDKKDFVYTLISSPAFLKRFGTSKGNLKHCVFTTSSGSLLELDTALATRRTFGTMPLEIFGSTETGGVATRFQMEANTPWTPLPGVRVSCDGEKGQLVVDSPFISDQSFVMSDVVELLESGNFHLQGRCDDIVKVEGKRVSLKEIEKRIKEYPGVSDSIVIFEEGNRQQTACVIELESNAFGLLAQIGKYNFNVRMRRHLSQYFENTTLPRRFRYVPEIFRNTQSKVENQWLRGLFNEL